MMGQIFTTLYSFMVEDLHLRGLQKEIFAIILGFWLSSRSPVQVTYSHFRRMTGASDSSISAALKKLEYAGLVFSDHQHGKVTKFSILLPDNQLQKYFPSAKESTQETEVLVNTKENYHKNRSTSKTTRENHLQKGGSNVLVVRDASSYHLPQ